MAESIIRVCRSSTVWINGTISWARLNASTSTAYRSKTVWIDCTFRCAG
jgi:hypothetical protein